MEINPKILEIVSNDTKNSIEQLSIVTPSIYASIFSEFSKKNDLTIENEESLSKDLIKSECIQLTSLQEQTAKNAKTLSDNTKKAIKAISEKDETSLKHVLEETKALRQEIEMLKRSVYQDELTHAFNRKWFHDNCLTNNNSFINDGTLAIIDLNYFKQINDTYGHIIGDKVLIFVTNELKKIKTPVIRYGGDEFILIFSATTAATKVIEILDKIRESMISKKLKANNAMFRVSFSFGITEFKANSEFSHVVQMADEEMYKDKREIKKRVTGI